jgi:hypothetical protein
MGAGFLKALSPLYAMISGAMGSGGSGKKQPKKGGGGGGGGEVVPQFKRGGKVKKTGLARVHKGERVLTKKQQKRARGRGSKKR